MINGADCRCSECDAIEVEVVCVGAPPPDLVVPRTVLVPVLVCHHPRRRGELPAMERAGMPGVPCKRMAGEVCLLTDPFPLAAGSAWARDHAGP